MWSDVPTPKVQARGCRLIIAAVSLTRSASEGDGNRRAGISQTNSQQPGCQRTLPAQRSLPKRQTTRPAHAGEQIVCHFSTLLDTIVQNRGHLGNRLGQLWVGFVNFGPLCESRNLRPKSTPDPVHTLPFFAASVRQNSLAIWLTPAANEKEQDED